MSQSKKTTSSPLVGIDFGTTKTMVAVYDPAKSHARTQRLGRGRDELPTAMFTTSSGELLYGDEAEDEGESDQVNLMRRFKMKLGHPGPAIVGRRKATAEELAADFLGHLKKRLETEVLHEQLQRAVLTVPAMFGPAQRKSLMNAANAAGFTNVTLLDEPTAAGLAYCDHNPVGKDLRFLVVDWGGGTFDVALLERSPDRGTKIIREFVAGMGDIGGEVLDDDLWGQLSQSLVNAGYERLDRQDRNMWGRYRREIARSKERLSNVESVKMNFLLNGGNPVPIDFQRSVLEDAISANVAKGANFVAELLDRCRAVGQIPDFVLLAGGTSRIPMIQRVFEERLQLECRKWSEGREAIALGAALHARDLWQPLLSPNGSQDKKSQNEKLEAMSIYRGLLEAAWADGVISAEERVFLGKRRKELGLTIEESRSLQIQILGLPIDEVCYSSSDRFAIPVASEEISRSKENGGKLDPDKGDFDVILIDAGKNKISAFNALLEACPEFGLAHAKQIVESTPCKIVESASKQTADDIKTYLENAGATLRLVGSSLSPTDQLVERHIDPKPSSLEPGYSERKFNCPNSECGKAMVLTPQELISKTYACPYCRISGTTDDKTAVSLNHEIHVRTPQSNESAYRDRVLSLIGKFTSETPDDSTYVWPKLPPKKIKNAIASYAKVNSSEILLLHDSTVFGSAKEGFIMTTTHIFWKDTNEQPRSIRFSEVSTIIENASSTFIGSGLQINGIPFSPNGGFYNKSLCSMFRKLILAIRAINLGN